MEVFKNEKKAYCPVSQNDAGKDALKIAAKLCTPSGWWCTSNTQCYSGSCSD